MQILENAFQARNKKQNKIEKVKELKNPREAYDKIAEYAKSGYDSIPDEDKKYFLKCFGIYDRPATPKKFMIKLRIPGGHLNSVQARVIGECAKEYGQDYIDLTTRQQCELRYLSIEDMPRLLERLDEAGIDAYQTGVDNIRSIMCDPLDGYGHDNVLASHNTLLKLQEKFLYDPEWISTLPRKFNTAITGSFSNRCNIFCHDASFVLAQKDGVYGYNMYLGGKVGKIAQDADIFLANEDEVIAAFSSIIEIFRKYGFRDNRNKNRLFFLLESVGIKAMSDAIRENAGIDFARAGETMTNMDFVDAEHGKVQLRDGSFALHVVVPSGIFSGSSLVQVADISERYGNKEIRFDMEQSLYVMGVKDVESALKESLFDKYKNIDSPYNNHLIACAGTEHCPFGVIENKNDAIEMSAYLDEKVPLHVGRVRLYWSACVKGCGIHGLGDIGFEGCKAKIDGHSVSGVNISLGGKLNSKGAEGYTVIKTSPLVHAKLHVESLMLEYKLQRVKNESFENYHDRVLKLFTPANIGFTMRLNSYMRSKNIDLHPKSTSSLSLTAHLGFNDKTKTGKNEEFELFELGRRLYYYLSKKEAYSAYERFSNVLKNEKLENIRDLVPHVDENLALLCDSILDSKEDKRAVVFSEVEEFIRL
ncbi:MAG: ferredoxin--nitrite reductase [Campylobacterota bacterium]|nr:ferredoxin--nitrite reductase [Campylobacterota bacterium]